MRAGKGEGPAAGAAGRPGGRGPTVAIAVVLVAAVVLAFSPLRESGFLNFDDDRYLTQNSRVKEGVTAAGVRWAFTTLAGGNWHPVTWISHQLDWSLFGADPRGHHRTNLLIHLMNTLLLFAALRRLTSAVWRSALAAALFALHPLHVESVAWVAERKDLLCGLFWMLALLAYQRHAARPSPGRYGVLLGASALGLMAKPMAVTLPFVLLLLDFWPLGRARGGRTWRALVLEKVPLILLSGVVSVVTLWAQRAAGAAEFGASLPFASRAGNAVISAAVYLRQMVWPARLAVLYPHPAVLSSAAILWCALLLAFFTGVAVVRRRTRPFLVFGWLWYLGTLVPVLGLVQVGLQARADRYTYLPLIGIFVAVAWSLRDVGGARARATPVVGIAAVLILGAFGSVTYRQAGYWRDSVTLFEHSLAVTEESALAHNNLGSAYLTAGRADKARPHLEAALRLRPETLTARANLGLVLLAEGKPEEAARHFRALLQDHPLDFRLHNNLGNALVKLGRIEEALRCYRLALALSPNNPEVRGNLARTEAVAAAAAGGRTVP